MPDGQEHNDGSEDAFRSTPPETHPPSDELDRQPAERKGGKLPDLRSNSPLRRLFGRTPAGVVGDMSNRLRALGRTEEPPHEQAIEAPEAEVQEARPIAGELVFTAGPRSGERILVEHPVSLDRSGADAADQSGAAAVMSIWAQGRRFMLRHNGALLIGGARPTLPVVTLEDGDELVWGPNRALFRFDQSVEARA
jgi:hypothetical protein